MEDLRVKLIEMIKSIENKAALEFLYEYLKIKLDKESKKDLERP